MRTGPGFFFGAFMAFATSNDFYARYDGRLLAQLSSDDNTAVADSTVIAALLADAQAEIQTAALRGSIYTVAQLTALVASGDTALTRLSCDLAMKMLVGRRVGGIPSALADIIKRANDMLDLLAKGARVLNIQANRGADIPTVITTTGLQRKNLNDLTANEFWSDITGTSTVDSPGT